MKLLESATIFLKGLFMGMADIVPGISGGTIAFITNIYERLLTGIKNLNITWAYNYFNYITKKNKKQLALAKKNWKRIDFAFFIPLILGIGIAILGAAHTISFLLQNYLNETMLFFIGLIFSSGIVIFKHIQSHEHYQIRIGIIGFLVGLSLVFLVPVAMPTNLATLVGSGFIASAAMLLPGISGSYILLLLGQYEAVITAVTELDILPLIAVAVGILLGVLLMSRAVTLLLKKHHSATLYGLTGLVFGSLSVPLNQIFFTVHGILWLAIGASIPAALFILKKIKEA